MRNLADELLSGKVKGKNDLECLVEGVRNRINRETDIHLRASTNSQVEEALRVAREKTGNRKQLEWSDHAKIGGVRTANQILADEFVSAQYGCTDLNTVLLAVLRAKGIPCRLARIKTIVQGIPKQTSYTEVKIGGKYFRIAPMKTASRVSEGLLEYRKEGDAILRSKDHAESGLNLRAIILDPSIIEEKTKNRK